MVEEVEEEKEAIRTAARPRQRTREGTSSLLKANSNEKDRWAADEERRGSLWRLLVCWPAGLW